MFKEGHGWGLLVRVNALCTFCALPAQLSVACTVKLNIPVVVGVPVINPDELRFKPDGKDPETRLNIIGDCPPDVVI